MRAITIQPTALFEAKQGEKTGKVLPAGMTFEFAEKSGTWLRRLDSTWVNCGSTFQYVSILDYGTTPPPPTDPPPTTTQPQPTHVIKVDELGRISVDGLPYA